MKDQAEKLRELMNRKIEHTTKRKAKVLAITSGKGGVGKTNFALNLAISIKRLDYKVLILDADFGLANIEILTGINIKYTIADLIVNDKKIHEIINEGPEGIKLISGGSGFHELSMMDKENIDRLLEELGKLEDLMDFIIIDTGAGVSNTVLDFVMAADEVILVTTPDPTSIMDGYTVIKALTTNGYKGKLNVITNIVTNRVEAFDTFDKLNRASQNFLKVDLDFLGYLERNSIVNNAVRNQTPFLQSNPSAGISKRINIMALKFIDSNADRDNNRGTSFAQKVIDLFLRRGGKDYGKK